MNKLSLAQEIHFDNFNFVTKKLNESLKEIDKKFEKQKLSDNCYNKVEMIINNLVTYNNYLQVLKLKYNEANEMLNDIKIDEDLKLSKS